MGHQYVRGLVLLLLFHSRFEQLQSPGQSKKTRFLAGCLFLLILAASDELSSFIDRLDQLGVCLFGGKEVFEAFRHDREIEQSRQLLQLCFMFRLLILVMTRRFGLALGLSRGLKVTQHLRVVWELADKVRVG